MEKEKFDIFTQYVKKAFETVSLELTETEFNNADSEFKISDTSLIVIIGITGKNKGRILFETSLITAKKISEIMNMEPLENDNDLYLYMGEFANIVSGRATTYINNHFRGSEIRLTPPAIFAGDNLDITTPNIQSQGICYYNDIGNVRINIGFEGV